MCTTPYCLFLSVTHCLNSLTHLCKSTGLTIIREREISDEIFGKVHHKILYKSTKIKINIQSSLKWPRLSMDFLSKVLGASTRLCCAHLLSRRRAQFLLWAAAAPPCPITSSRPKRTWAWPRTAHTDSSLRSNEVDSTISASSVLSCPLLPS